MGDFCVYGSAHSDSIAANSPRKLIMRAPFRRQHRSLDKRTQPVERLRSQRLGAVWLFTIERKDWRAKRGRPAAVIGPLPVERGPTLAADYLRSVFSPGITAPVHIHSGRRRSLHPLATPAWRRQRERRSVEDRAID